MKVWYIAGKAFTDIEDAANATVGLVGEREIAIYEAKHADSLTMIFKEARADLQQMCEGDMHDFLGVQIIAGSLNIDVY